MTIYLPEKQAMFHKIFSDFFGSIFVYASRHAIGVQVKGDKTNLQLRC